MTIAATDTSTLELLADLDATVSGRVLTQLDTDFPAASTPWNLVVGQPPIAVVEADNVNDVVVTVQWAARAGVEIAVRNTGHGATGFDRPTLVLSTRGLDQLTIDPIRRSARVGAGVNGQQVLDAAAPYGLAPVVGSAPNVGVVGYLTGGGLSPIGRTFGYGSDLVTAFDVVTGDGVVRRVTATENRALFWGLRGGKGALGIVTAVEFGLLDLPEIFAGCLFFAGADAAAVVETWRCWSADLPESVTTSIAFMRLPDMPTVPPPLAGRLSVAVRFVFTGDKAQGAQLLAPMQAAAPVILGGVGPMPFAAIGAVHNDPVDPMPSAEYSALLSDFSADAAVALLGAAGPNSPCSLITVEVRQLGGALGRTPSIADAVSFRGAAVNVFAVGLGIPPLAEPNAASIAAVAAAIGPWVVGAQVNFNTTADPHQLAKSYDPATLGKLGALAETLDPHRVLSVARVVREACQTVS